ncbi:type II secretion system F family protein [Paenibacillus lutrae]|uniref:Type II secretion system protein GspF domain-containing protein n=1 Tax=Paenibacillus lutrae TaxID=2078573 RepID=A0A7X3K0Z5_9BACL|nr:type II secretion system F family protein [Paenibacillus lutrae]MVP01600.1 hypothetical protein [Paenibacillus lutrae]
MQDEWLLYGAVFLTVLFGVLAVAEITSSRKRQNALNKQLRPLYAEHALKKDSSLRRAQQRLNRTEYGREWEDQLRSADLKLSPAHWLLIRLALFAVVTVLLTSLLDLKAPYNLIAGYFGVRICAKQWLKGRRLKYAEQINRQLPEVCRMLSSSVRAGLSIQQGIEMVAKELKAPAGPLFMSMSSELQIGTTLDEVLERLHERFTSKDIQLLTQTILVQRKAGGNLSQALDHLAKTLEERSRMNKEISNQTAESRYIAISLAVMPLFLVIVFNTVFKGFIMPIFTLPGLILLAVVVVMMLVGFVLIRKVSHIKA